MAVTIFDHFGATPLLHQIINTFFVQLEHYVLLDPFTGRSRMVHGPINLDGNQPDVITYSMKIATHPHKKGMGCLSKFTVITR
jgi:hypothetical protein